MNGMYGVWWEHACKNFIFHETELKRWENETISCINIHVESESYNVKKEQFKNNCIRNTIFFSETFITEEKDAYFIFFVFLQILTCL
jgi:hypothetical protein